MVSTSVNMTQQMINDETVSSGLLIISNWGRARQVVSSYMEKLPMGKFLPHYPVKKKQFPQQPLGTFANSWVACFPALGRGGSGKWTISKLQKHLKNVVPIKSYVELNFEFTAILFLKIAQIQNSIQHNFRLE